MTIPQEVLNIGDVFQLDISNKQCGPYAGKYFRVEKKTEHQVILSKAYDDKGLTKISSCNGMVRVY